MTETTDHPIRLRNTLTRRVERFVPLDWQRGDVPEAERRVRMYVCGPTVYDRAHLGNARSAVVFDVLFRLLRHVYGEERVTYVRNITDIDDKIIARAKETGRPVEAITEETIRWYHEDMDALGCLRPTHEPRATEYLPQMIAMIEALIEKGHAYEAEGHVLFAVESYRDYGRLSGRSVEDMIAGARVEVAPYKRHPMDFVLWKPSGEGMPGWDSPWGLGRPGWHIECSAMARDLLGGAFDIHGGGLDLQFPHHENEIAQSRCAHPEEGFAQVWVHNEMLRVEGEKMSKSLGNFFTVRDMLDRGVPGEVMRLVLLSGHYSKPLDWSEEKVEEATDDLIDLHFGLRQGAPGKHMDSVAKALSNDLSTPLALSLLQKSAGSSNAQDLKDNLLLLGIYSNHIEELAYRLRTNLQQLTSQLELLRASIDLPSRQTPEVRAFTEDLDDLLVKPPLVPLLQQITSSTQRATAAIKAVLDSWSELVEEFPDEVRYIRRDVPISQYSRNVLLSAQQHELVRRIKDRERARNAKDFDYADKIREEAQNLGFQITDTKEGQRWTPLV